MGRAGPTTPRERVASPDTRDRQRSGRRPSAAGPASAKRHAISATVSSAETHVRHPLRHLEVSLAAGGAELNPKERRFSPNGMWRFGARCWSVTSRLR